MLLYQKQWMYSAVRSSIWLKWQCAVFHSDSAVRLYWSCEHCPLSTGPSCQNGWPRCARCHCLSLPHSHSTPFIKWSSVSLRIHILLSPSWETTLKKTGSVHLYCTILQYLYLVDLNHSENAFKDLYLYYLFSSTLASTAVVAILSGVHIKEITTKKMFWKWMIVNLLGGLNISMFKKRLLILKRFQIRTIFVLICF